MKKFRSLFPFTTTSKIPENIEECLSKNPFDELKEGFLDGSGFACLSETQRFIYADGRWLFKYVEQSRKVNDIAVNNIYQQRLQKASETGRILDEETAGLFLEQARREVAKFAPIRESVVHILFDGTAGFIWCAGSTIKKCEDALKALRRVTGKLEALPLSLENAPYQLARTLQNNSLLLQDNLEIPACGKIKMTNIDGDCNASFSGVDLREKHIAEVICGMKVLTAEMNLTENRAGKRETLASFELHLPARGNVGLKAVEFAGAAGDESGDPVHDLSVEMLLAATTGKQMVSALRQFFIGVVA